MTELTLQYNYFSRLIVGAVFALLYGLGGIHGKWKRRFIAPFVLVVCIVVYSLIAKDFHWAFLLTYPIMVGGLSLGYGSSAFGVKFRKRLLCGLAMSVAALPIVIFTHQWILFALHTLVCTVYSTVLGTQNPIPARGEETLIGFTFSYLLLFMV